MFTLIYKQAKANLNGKNFSIVETTAFTLLVVIAATGLYYGWKLFWFLTDDAFIAFRYVSNSIMGHGYVWNPQPFIAVEGYTSFLWVILLDIVWRVTGKDPTESANIISLVFSYGTFFLSSWTVIYFHKDKWKNKYRFVIVTFFITYILLNRTYLTWTSSGLETAMFNFFLISWVCALLMISKAWLRIGMASAISSFLYLTRPDGLLFCAALLAMAGIEIWLTIDRKATIKLLLSCLIPLSPIVIHLTWRLSFYGEWLPNTYYAKVIAMWPESGVLYAFSFMLEYALWLPVTLFCLALGMALTDEWRRYATQSVKHSRKALLKEIVADHGVQILTVTAIFAHLGYYTIIVGGDHFEFRVYSHIIPLIFIGLIWALNKLKLKIHLYFLAIFLFVALSMPVQWSHWMLTKDLNTREETHVMIVPISSVWPAPFRWYAAMFDSAQSWLIEHHVGMRHQEHKVFWQTQVENYPSRKRGMTLPAREFPVYAEYCVGVPSWTLPNVNIVDVLGLNDYIIARNETRLQQKRLMAHSRRPPEGYVESFIPNVVVDKETAKLRILKRQNPLTEEDIRNVEQYWRQNLDRGTLQQAGNPWLSIVEKGYQ